MLRYRPNAALIIFNRAGEVLCGQRINIPGAWQFPQGGMEETENPVDAALREAWEEFGLAKDLVRIAGVLNPNDPWCYDVAESSFWAKKGFKGQAQTFVLAYCPNALEHLDLSGKDGEPAEFSSARWQTLDSLMVSVPDFKRPVFEKVIATAPLRIREWLAANA